MYSPLPKHEVIDQPPPLSPFPENATQYECAAGMFYVARYRLASGPWAGVELVLVDSGLVRAAICPTRGMSIWKAMIDGHPVGWDSPVQGPIHPSLVQLAEPSGLGWLDGFDELLVRCGLNSFGAPDVDERGILLYPLHGRIGNTPAQRCDIRIDCEHSFLEIHGVVSETRFLQYNLQLEVSYRFPVGQPIIEVYDRVTNARSVPGTMQLLYHINIGKPLLGQGSQLHVSAPRVVARNEHAARDIDQWHTYLAPTPGYEEQVYFFQGTPVDDQWAAAMLESPDGNLGLVVRYDTSTLPYFTQWKNTVGEADGYVTGLEPATGFPNPRSFEQEQGRVVSLDAGQTREFQLKLELLTDAQALAAERQRLRAVAPTETVPFDPQWCMPR